MLQLLHIENIAIIECADIAFRPGFNALTGETGAGFARQGVEAGPVSPLSSTPSAPCWASGRPGT